MKRVASIVVLLLLFFSVGALCAEMASVNVDIANLRADAGTQHEILGKLKKGTGVYILCTEGDWSYIRTAKGETGWIYAELLSK